MPPCRRLNFKFHAYAGGLIDQYFFFVEPGPFDPAVISTLP